MVKPPRSMQPEGMDLTKAGRNKTKAFGENSFHNYMARKIDMQRQQFGLMLPPTPPSSCDGEEEEEESADQQKQQSQPHSHQHSPSASSSSVHVPSESQPPSSPRNHLNNHKKRVTFHSSVVDTIPRRRRKRRIHRPYGQGRRRRQLLDTTFDGNHQRNNNNNATRSSIGGVLSKLGKRHGLLLVGTPSSSLTAVVKNKDDMDDTISTYGSPASDKTVPKTSEKPANGNVATTAVSDNSSSSPMNTITVDDDDDDSQQQKSSLSSSQAASPTIIIMQQQQQQPAVDAAKSPVSILKNSSPPYFSPADDATSLTRNNSTNSDSSGTSLATTNSSTSKKKKQPKRRRNHLFLQGVVVLVNGYTHPDTDTLQRLLHRHGGDLEKYETSRITHIVAEHLSTAKAKMYTRVRAGRPVVYPQWIVDCVQHQKLLPHADYLIREVSSGDTSSSGGGRQQSVTCLFAKVSSSSSPASAVRVPVAPSPRTKIASTDDDNSKKVSKEPLPRNPSCTGKVENKSPSNNSTHNNDNHKNKDENNTRPSSSEEKSIERSSSHATRSTMTKDGSPSSSNKYIHGKIRTTGTDPNFLASFFENSRLSFIGSYKQRVTSANNGNSTSNNTQPHNNNKGTSMGGANMTSPNRHCGAGGSRQQPRHHQAKKWVLHVDMDCFFASVALRNFPEHQGKPVAISHNGNDKANNSTENARMITGTNNSSSSSTSECATCNYEARKFGIKKGMFLGRAKELCPDLVVLRYDFDGYEEVAEQVADILQTRCDQYHGSSIEHVSCDEAYLEIGGDGDTVGDLSHTQLATLAEDIRKEILSATQCTATVGVAKNKFLAKLATDKAKPNGSFVVTDTEEHTTELLRHLALRDLHGVGYRTERKLANEGLASVQDVWDMGKHQGEQNLIRILGPGLGKKIYWFCYGVDDREVKAAERKTIGAECNYGVRFDDGPYGVDYMIEGLAKEVSKRMEATEVRGSKLTLKVKQRKPGAKPPPKFLGHGSCHNLSKSRDVPGVSPTRSWEVISTSAYQMFLEMKLDVNDIRGMGIIMSTLVSDNASNIIPGTASSIKKWFQTANGAVSMAPVSTTKEARTDNVDSDEVVVAELIHTNAKPRTEEESNDCFDIELPSMSQLRMSQVEHLPSPMRKGIHRRLEKSREVEEQTLVSHTVRASDPRMRQTDVKRMMRLAAVRSGHDSLSNTLGSTVSMTQFESLPLEVQLQVANGDGFSLGARESPKKQKSLMSKEHPKKRRKIEVVVLDADDGDDNILEIASAPHSSSTECEKNASGNESLVAVEPASPGWPLARSSSREFFHDNIMPLMAFMDENGTSSEAVQRVNDFISLFISDHSLTDVGILLRAVKNRNDSWGTSALEPVLETAVACVQQTQGVQLDLRYMGLVK